MRAENGGNFQYPECRGGNLPPVNLPQSGENSQPHYNFQYLNFTLPSDDARIKLARL
jgi:hypothetical protein